MVSFSAGNVARWIEYPDHREYVIWFAWILALDCNFSYTFAYLRAQNRPSRFAWIKMTNISVNIVLKPLLPAFMSFILNIIQKLFPEDLFH